MVVAGLGSLLRRCSSLRHGDPKYTRRSLTRLRERSRALRPSLVHSLTEKPFVQLVGSRQKVGSP